MKKKYICVLVLFFCFLSSVFAQTKSGGEFGFGSGYVFYGSDTLRKQIKNAGSNQLVLSTDAAFLFPIEKPVYLSLGGDMTFDAHWKGSDHFYLFDYAFLLGFRFYPGFGGLLVSTDYALGRRTDFISYQDESYSKSTSWGNGFKFGIAYDFSYNSSGYAPVVGTTLKSMPRGNYRDNIFSVFIRLTKGKL